MESLNNKMNTSKYFQVGKNNIGYIGLNFQEHFLDTEFEIPKKLKLQHKVLERGMTAKEILEEFKPQESNLGELAWALKNYKKLLKNGYANIFYIRDKKGTLWTVYAYWHVGRGWNVDAYPVTNPDEWNAGSQVVSQVFSVLDSLDSGDLEKRVKELEKDMERLRKIINL